MLLKHRFARVAGLSLLSSAILLSSCAGDPPDASVNDQSESTPDSSSKPGTLSSSDRESVTSMPLTPVAGSQAPRIAPLATQNPLRASSVAVATGERLADEIVAQLLADLSGTDQEAAAEALETISNAGDSRFIAVMIELMRGRELGIVGGTYSKIINTLEGLSGQEFGQDWPGWIEWYGKTDLEPPPGFTTWKGQLLGRIDPGFGDFLQDEHPSRIRVEEIQWGGVPIDGIPPLEFAPTIPGAEEDYLLDEEPVFGVVVNGDARAYPLRIIDNHEMANDEIGGVPVSLAYCTLCGAAIAYDGRGPDGENYDFGTSGFLYRSNKLMYDRQTRTLWNQLTGEPVLGELADQDIRLEILPIVLTAWADWLEQHPDTLVLDRDTGIYPPEIYEPGIFYGDYFAASDTMFPVWQRSGLLAPKEFVYALHIDGVPKAYQVEALAADQVLNDTIGLTPVVLVSSRGTVAVEGEHQYLGPVNYNVGGEVRVFNRGDELYSPGPEPNTVLDSVGDSWQVTEDGLVGPDGSIAPRIPGHLAYWFGWYAFFPDTLLYSDSSPTGGEN